MALWFGKETDKFFDLNLKPAVSRPKDRVELLKRCQGFGWDCIVWNTSTFAAKGLKGGLGSSSTNKPNTSLSLSTADSKQTNQLRCLLRHGIDSMDTGRKSSSTLLSSSSKSIAVTLRSTPHQISTETSQLSRITITLDDVLDAQAMTAANEQLKPYDIVAVTPTNAEVFSYCCKTAQIDLISLDFTRRLAIPIIKKLVDEAVARGIFFEINYAPIVMSSATRSEVLSGSRILIQFLRGRNLILSSGSEGVESIRGPHDVINIGQMLKLTPQQAKQAISANCRSLLKHAAARKLKFLPAEIVPMSEVLERWPSFQTRYSKQPQVPQVQQKHRGEAVRQKNESNKKRRVSDISDENDSRGDVVNTRSVAPPQKKARLAVDDSSNNNSRSDADPIDMDAAETVREEDDDNFTEGDNTKSHHAVDGDGDCGNVDSDDVDAAAVGGDDDFLGFS